MALLGNYQQFAKNPIRTVGGSGVGDTVGLRSNWNQKGDTRNSFYGETRVTGVSDTYGLPAGYLTPYSWIMPTRDGGMGIRINGTSYVNATESSVIINTMVATFGGTCSMYVLPIDRASIAADIFVNQAQATTDEIVRAVWGAAASSYNSSGTMGQKLNGAGTAGDPWTADLTPYNTPNTAGKQIKDSVTIGKFLALK